MSYNKKTVEQINDINLFYRIKNDNRLAFDTLFRKYYPLLCNFARSFTFSKDDAEEIVQEVFIHFWNKRSEITITRSVKSLLYTMVKNNGLNFIKKNKTRVKYESDFFLESTSSTGEDAQIDYQRFDKIIKSGIDRLPPKCKMVFILSRNDGLTYEEIGEYLQISRNTVENQMSIALRKLREHVKPYIPQIIFSVFLVVWILGFVM